MSTPMATHGHTHIWVHLHVNLRLVHLRGDLVHTSLSLLVSPHRGTRLWDAPFRVGVEQAMAQITVRSQAFV